MDRNVSRESFLTLQLSVGIIQGQFFCNHKILVDVEQPQLKIIKFKKKREAWISFLIS